MRNRIGYSSLSLIFLSAMATLMVGCFKEKKIVVSEQKVFFVPSTAATYRVTGPTVIYKIPVGLTKPLEDNKTISVTVTTTSSTGAVVGTHYSYNNTLTFANKVTDTIIVTGVYNQYTSGRKDIVTFNFSSTDMVSTSLNPSFTLNIRGACVEDDIMSGGFSALLGDYTRTFENGSYGPYTSSFTNATSVTSTSAKATLNNIYGSSISAVADFSFATVAGFSVSIADQQTQYTVGGLPLYVKSVSPGTFTYCVPTFTITMQLYTSAGIYDQWVMTMAR